MDKVQFLPNERVDIDDMRDATANIPVDEQIRDNAAVMLPSGRATGGALTDARILKGFALTNLGSGIANVEQGTAIVKVMDNGSLKHGILIADEGPANLTMDFSSSGTAKFDVYMRFVYSGGDFQNRVFWNPSGAPAQEFIDNVATRNKATWEVTFVTKGASPPGNGDFVKIWEVDVIANAINVAGNVDFRHFYYEGDANNSYAQEWGSGTDRNANRAAYGIGDEHYWKQMVRRQLKEIIGEESYSLPKTSLLAASRKIDRFVTVDQPAGAKGEYATLTAAFTALNAANGGTILLRKGVYIQTTALTATERVNILAVESGVTIQNGINVDNTFAINYNAGSEGSWISGVTFIEFLSSEHQIYIAADRVQISQCSIVGEVEVNGAVDVLFEQCRIIGSTVGTFATQAIWVTGADPRVSFDRCEIRDGAAGVGDTVVISSITATLGPAEVEFRNSKFKIANENRGINVSTGNVNVSIDKCNFEFATPVANRPGMLVTNCEKFSIVNTFIVLEDTVDWEASLIKYDVAGVDGQSCHLENVSINFQQTLPKMTSLPSVDSPLYFRGNKVDVNNCHFYNIKFNDDAILTEPLFMHVDPYSEGNVAIRNCRFTNISSVATNNIDMSLLGQEITFANAGTITIEGCLFDGKDQIYGTGSSSHKMLSFEGICRHVFINNNRFEGGTWFNVIKSGGIGVVKSILLRGNFFIFDDDTLFDINRIVLLEASTTADSANGMIVASENVFIHVDIAATSGVLTIEGGGRVVVIGNAFENIESALGTFSSIAIGQSTLTGKVTMYANIMDDNIVVNATNPIPDNATENIGDHNIIT